MTSSQDALQASIRSHTGTAYSLNEDWTALFNQDGIAAGSFEERQLAWINARLGTAHTTLVEARHAFAVGQGKDVWSELDAIGAVSGPTFTSPSSASAPENSADSATLYSATATGDPPISFSLIADPDNLFEIIGGDVSLQSGKSLNYETKTNHTFTLRATDGNTATAQHVVTLNVTDIDEVPPVFTSAPTASAAETVGDTAALYTATANEPCTFSLVLDVDNLFEITAGGILSLQSGKSLNYESKTSHAVTIRANDGLNTTDQVVTIAVTNVNEGPTITSGASATVAENIADTVVIYTGTATDPDAGTSLAWSLPVDDGGRFEIDASSGEVSLASGQALDFETATAHNITVRVSDGTLNADKAVTITVTDVAEGASGPAFVTPVETSHITTAAQTISVNKPTSATNGRIGLIGLTLNDAKTVSAPTGWTTAWSERNNALTGSCFYRSLDGTEGASESLTWSSNELAEAIYLAYENCLIGPVSGTGEVNGTSVSAPSITIAGGDENGLLLLWFYQRLTTTTVPIVTLPSGFAVRHTQNDTLSTGAGLYMIVAEKSVTASGATGAQLVTSDLSGRLVAAQLYLKPGP